MFPLHVYLCIYLFYKFTDKTTLETVVPETSEAGQTESSAGPLPSLHTSLTFKENNTMSQFERFNLCQSSNMFAGNNFIHYSFNTLSSCLSFLLSRTRNWTGSAVCHEVVQGTCLTFHQVGHAALHAPPPPF